MSNSVKTTTSNGGGIDIKQYFKGKESALRKEILNGIELNKEKIKHKYELHKIEFKKSIIERVTLITEENDDEKYEITVRIPFEFDSTLLGISTNLYDAYQFKKTKELEEELESDGIKLIVRTDTLEISSKVDLLLKELSKKEKGINEGVKEWNNRLEYLIDSFENKKNEIKSFIHEYNK